MKKFLSTLFCAAFVVGVALCAGCSGAVDGHYSVSGTVKHGGELVEYGRIAFQPTGESGSSSSASPISKGKYEIPAGKGLTPGEYYVIFTIEEPSGETETFVDHKGEETVVEKTVTYVPLDWGARSTQKVEIKPKKNVLDFDVPRAEEPVAPPEISGNPSGDF